MKIRVKTLDRKDQELEVADDATLGVLRKLIEEKMGIVESRQRLIFQGHPLLCNEQLLRDYGIVDGLTLHMVERPVDAGVPPGLNSQRLEHEHAGGDEHMETMRYNIVDGEMVIIRNSVFQDINTTQGYVREAISHVLSSIHDCTSMDVETQPDSPRIGDFTIQVNIRSTATQCIDSGSLRRINFISDGLRRSEHTLKLLEKEPFSSITSGGFEHVMSSLGDDFQQVQFGQKVLELEEILYIPRADLSDAPEIEKIECVEGGESRSSTSAHDSRTPSTILRSATAEEYAEILQRILTVQNLANNRLRQYQEMILRRGTMSNSHVRYIALIYEEHLRRVLHRLSHAYHSMSDVAVDFWVPNSPLEPSTAEHHPDPMAEVSLTLIFSAQNERDALTRTNSEGRLQSSSDSTSQIHHMAQNTVRPRAFFISQPIRVVRRRSALNPTIRTPAVITVPDVGTTGNRTAFIPSTGMAAGPVHVQSARLHVSTSGTPRSEVRVETSGTTGSNARRAEGNNPNMQPSTTDSTGNQTQLGGSMNASVRGGIQNFLRNILPNAFGNMTPMQPGQTTLGAQTATNLQSRLRNTLLEMHNRHHGQAPANRPSMPAFRAQYGPGIVGQLIVRTNGPTNAEAARRALDAAVQAATAAVGENGVHLHMNGMPRMIPPMSRNGGNVLWARRTYSGRVNRDIASEPNDMFIGPHYPNDSTFYTNDPHLICQSNLCSPRTDVRYSTAYGKLISDLYQAALRYKASLPPMSPEVTAVESLIRRWDRVRGLHDDDAHVAVNQRGEALFERPEQFKNVLIMMLRRAVSNLADADADIAQRLNASQGEYLTTNYGMVPIISAPLHGFDIPEPPVMPTDLEAVDLEIQQESFNTSRDAQVRDDSTGDDALANRTDNTQESMSSENQSSSAVESGENDLDVVEIVRTLSELMQSGRSTTLSQVMREMGQPVTRFDSGRFTGFINLVMVLAYEILQIPELVQILNGNFSSLSKNRQQIRRFLIEHVFDDNCRPSDEDLRNAAERVALEESELNRFLAYNDVHRYADVDGIGRIDLIASVLRLEKRVVEEFLRHLMRTDDDLTAEEYSKTVVDMFTAYVYRGVVLTNLSMSGQPYDYEGLLYRFMERPSGVDSRQLLTWMAQMSMSHIRRLLRRETPFTVHDMLDDIVLVTDGGEAVGSGSVASAAETENIPGPANKCGQSNNKEKKDGGRTVIDVEMQEAQDSAADSSWMSALPKDWVSVIEDDRNRSVTKNVKSFSDAYLGGSYSTKRKGMKVAVEGSFDSVVSSAVKRSMEEALSSSGFSVPDISDATEATRVLQNEFDDLLRQRVTCDEKFDPVKYPELNKFLKKRDS